MHKRSFFDFFPAPSFLQMPSLGFSIADSAIRFVQFDTEKEQTVLKKYGEVPLPEGIVSSGQIEQPEELIKLVSEFKKKYDIKYVRSTLPEEKAYLFTAWIPKVEDNEIRSSIEFIIEENVPLMVSESVFDYEIIDNTDNAKRNSIEVAVSVLPTEAVSMYHDVLSSAGLTPVHYAIESQALSKAIVPMGSPGPFLIVHLCRAKMGFYIVYGGTVNFTSTITISPVNGDPFGENSGRPIEDVYPPIRDVTEEIKKIFIYWRSQSDKFGIKDSEIKKCFICGIFGNTPGIEDYIEKEINIPTEIGNVWTNAFSLDDFVPDIPKDQSLGFATSIGLAIPKIIRKHV